MVEEEGFACIPLSINRQIQEYTDIKTQEANLGRAGGRLISAITFSILSLKLTSAHAYYLQLQIIEHCAMFINVGLHELHCWLTHYHINNLLTLIVTVSVWWELQSDS